jgi:hypothetical protein
MTPRDAVRHPGLPQLPPIPVFISRRALGLHALEPASGVAPTNRLPLVDWGVTWSMAQETRWIDRDSFAVGRWDGTLTLFRVPDRPKQPPVIESAAITPAWAGVQMITPLDHTAFATSNDEESMIVWEARRLPRPAGTAETPRPSDRATALTCRTVLRYEASLGISTHGAFVEHEGKRFFISGHSSGRLAIWQVDPELQHFTLATVVDLRSPDPVPSPYPVVDIRGVVPWREGTVVTGSEDGDLCIVHIPDGRITARVRYNAQARRGINDLAVAGDFLLVANCAVGPDDRNTWLFRLDAPDRIAPVASVNLRQQPDRPQVFNFSVELLERNGALVFFAATEEGLLWMGSAGTSGFEVLGTENVSSSHGATVTFERASNMLAVVGDNVHLYQLS